MIFAVGRAEGAQNGECGIVFGEIAGCNIANEGFGYSETFGAAAVRLQDTGITTMSTT
jgi:hypothetical protein